MINKSTKILILILVMTLIGGCTKYLSDSENKRIIYDKTGQAVTSNILCLPKDKELLKIYEENEDKLTVKLDNLPECSNFKPTDIKYVGIWESIFVKPLAWAIIIIGSIVNNYGISVMIIGLLIRFALMPLSKKSLVQSKKMKEISPELKKIEKKYKDKTDKDSMMLKSQETMAMYKKQGINPMSGCLVSLLQLPLFFAFLEAINRVPAIFEEKLLTLQLGTTPWIGIGQKNYLYILLIVLIIVSTYFSLKDTLTTSPGVQSDQEKQSKYMVIFMMVFISFASFSLPTAIALYWIVTNAFSAVQNVLIKRKG